MQTEPVILRDGNWEYRLILPSLCVREFEKEAKIGIFEFAHGWMTMQRVPHYHELVILFWAAAKTHSPHLDLTECYDRWTPAKVAARAEFSSALAQVLANALGLSEREPSQANAPAESTGGAPPFVGS